MRKVIVSVEVSLDSVLETPEDFIFDFIDDELTKRQHDLLFGADALLMGRVTYEGFVDYWPNHGDDEFGGRMNNLPKYVASRTLEGPLQWNATLLENVAEEIAALKAQPGQTLLQYGIGELTHTLMQHGLVDEFHLFVYPVVVGKGGRIFENMDKTTLKLLDTKRFPAGVIALRYQPDRKSE
jgi:dihydrofolate reductase